MLNYQQIVDSMRSCLYSIDPETVDVMLALHADYSFACDETNQRLSKCGLLLRKGLRSEAIRQAEIEPNLLDLVATLDFPERTHWEAVCAKLQIARPPSLLVDVAAELNEAYALEQPAAALLRQHRLL